MRSFIKEFFSLLRNIKQESGNQARVFSYDESDLTSFIIEIRPKTGPFAHGSFLFLFEVSADYPDEHPSIYAISDITHPNISNSKTANVCLNLLDSWTSGFGIMTLVNGLIFLFNEPNYDDPYHDIFSEVEDKNSYIKDELSETNTRFQLHNKSATWEGEEEDSFAETHVSGNQSEEDNKTENGEDEDNPFDAYLQYQYSVAQRCETVSYNSGSYLPFNDYGDLCLTSAVTQEITVGTDKDEDSDEYSCKYYFGETGPIFFSMGLVMNEYSSDFINPDKEVCGKLSKVVNSSDIYKKEMLTSVNATEYDYVFFGIDSSNNEFIKYDFNGESCKTREPMDLDVKKLSEDKNEALISDRLTLYLDYLLLNSKFPWWGLLCQTRFPMALAPGKILYGELLHTYMYQPQYAEFRRCSSNRLICDINRAIRKAAVKNELSERNNFHLLVLDPLTLSPLSPVLMTGIVSSKLSMYSTSWLSVYETIRCAPSIISMNGLFSWMGTSKAAELMLISNWILYLSRCELYQSLGYSRLQFTDRRTIDYVGSQYLCNGLSLLPCATPLFDAVWLQLGGQVLRSVSRGLLKLCARASDTHFAEAELSSTAYTNVTVVPYSDLDVIC